MSLIIDSLSRLSSEELLELIKLFDQNYVPAATTSRVLVEGKILPFMREVSCLPEASRDEVARTCVKMTASLMDISKPCEGLGEKELMEHLFSRYREDLENTVRDLNDEQRLQFLLEWNKAVLAAGVEPAMGLAESLLRLALFIKTVSLALGVVFPFNLYTIALIMLSILLGPMGWLTAAFIILYKSIPELMKDPRSMVAVIILASINRYMEERETSGEQIGSFEPFSLLGLDRRSSSAEVRGACSALQERLRYLYEAPGEGVHGKRESLAYRLIRRACEAAEGGGGL
jgi:hypothetical protein